MTVRRDRRRAAAAAPARAADASSTRRVARAVRPGRAARRSCATATRTSSPAASASASGSRARCRVSAVAADRRRAGVGARRLGAGGDPQPAARPPARHGLLVPVHHPRPRDGRVPLRPRRGDVPRPDRRDGAARASCSRRRSTRTRRRCSRRPSCRTRSCSARGTRIVLEGDIPSPLDAAVGLPLPHALPARPRVGAAVARRGAGAARRRRRAPRRLPPRRPGRRDAATLDRRCGATRDDVHDPARAARHASAMVASTHWLASAAGMAVLERGGNAFDAAVAAGFTLQVVEPHLNGPGGDLPAVFWPAAARRAARRSAAQGVAPGGGDDRALPRARPRPRARHRACSPRACPARSAAGCCCCATSARWRLEDVLAFAIGYAERRLSRSSPGSRATIERDRGRCSASWPASAELYLPRAASPARSSATRRSPRPTAARSTRRAAARARRRSSARARASTRASSPRRSTASSRARAAAS